MQVADTIRRTTPPRQSRINLIVLVYRETAMKDRLGTLKARWASKEQGGIGYIFLWLLGVPIPVLILISLLRGCN